MSIMALSNVVGLPILSTYPDSGDEFAVLLSNADEAILLYQKKSTQ